MTLGLSRSRLGGDIEHELRRIEGVDSQTARRITDAIAETIYRNNQQIERQLRAAGLQL
jgi:hypothetical protein